MLRTLFIGSAIVVAIGVGVVVIRQIISKRELSYEEVMRYFIKHKSDKNTIVAGALFKEDVKGGYIITQTFLDKNNQTVKIEKDIPLGRKYNVTKLDDELMHLFQDNDLIIIK